MHFIYLLNRTRSHLLFERCCILKTPHDCVCDEIKRKPPLSRLGLNLHPYDIHLATVAIKRYFRYCGEISLLNQNLDSGQILQILSSNTREQEVQIQPTMA